MKSIIIKYSLFVWALCAYLNLNAQNEYISYIDSADVFIKNKNWLQAERCILMALQKEPANPNNSLLISNLATIQRKEHKYGEALKNYDVAISMTPKAVTLLKNRASLYVELDSLNHAYMDYEKVMLLDSEDVESRYYHGLIALRKGHIEIAKADINDLLRIDKYSPYTKEAQGTLQKTLGNFSDAVDYFSDLISMQSKPSYQTLINRAECYLELNKLQDAEKDIKQGLEMAPSEPYLYVLRARLNKLRHNHLEKERDLRLAEKYGIKREMAIFFMK